jgi:ABC-type Fe3+/spermidine/putrescine transport system ATPase subunit
VLFEVCRITHLLKRKTDQLSGGEKQRIALARLLVGSPRLLLLDEPFSNMDPIHKNLLKSVLQDISEQLQITCMLTSHDPMDTLSWADEIWVMWKGLFIQKGTPVSVYHQPINEYAAGLFGSYNLFTEAETDIFPGLRGLPRQDGQVFTRPEQFRIGPETNGSLAGIIEKISFWGSYYEILVDTGIKKLIVKTMQSQFAEGERVYISFDAMKL